ncbi:MAG: hypothetical protein FH751_14365 [Firmicutes bacterium]|nr:hypothetical protein [Bacillota bacterium]
MKELKKEISKKLNEFFVINRHVYAEQKSDGNYATIYKRFDALKIYNMIENKKSILAYMEKHGKIKWICFDFDIESKQIQSNDSRDKIVNLLSNIFEQVKKLCKYLKDKNIDYLLEFSGNRGFHVWIIFNDYISKQEGYEIITKILKNIQFDSEILNLDKYPTTSIKSRIGKGVKLPFSYHSKSNKYSYFLKNIEQVNISNIFIDNLDKDFLKEQLEVLLTYKKPKKLEILNKLNIEIDEDEKSESNLKVREIEYMGGLNLEDILLNITKCSILNELLSNYPFHLSHKTRLILVGLFNRIKTEDDKDAGKKLLFELFSRMQNFRPELTKKKLDNIKYFPVTCNYLKEAYDNLGEGCNCCEKYCIKSPIELLDDIELVNYNLFEVSPSEVFALKRAQIQYNYSNDEVPFNFILNNIQETDEEYLTTIVNDYINAKDEYSLGRYYNVIRYEKNKSREFVILNAQDNLITTALIKKLNEIYGMEFSKNSYAYVFNHNLQTNNRNDVFKYYFRQWLMFRKEIEERITDEVLENYYIIKFDLKSFYDEIDIGILREKLIQGPVDNIKQILREMTESDKKKYRTIINMLVSIVETVGSKGVPQGPAFARYLAEVYLMQLDKFIEKHISDDFEFYFRYVDDIILIIENERKAEDIGLKIREYISKLHLTINENKYLFGQVKDMKNEFLEYLNENKYFIDSVNKKAHIATNKQKRNSNKLLYKLVDGIDKEENLNFYFTHIKNNKRNNITDELKDYMFKLKEGRGSLFKNFFKFYFKNYDISEEGDSFMELQGLAKTNFLNQLYISNKSITNKKLEWILKQISNSNLEVYDYDLILHIMWSRKDCFIETLFEEIPDDIIDKNLRCSYNKEIPTYCNGKILQLLKDETNHVEFIIKLYNLIFKSKFDNEIIKEITNIFFDKMMRSVEAYEVGEFVPEYFKMNLIIDHYYQLLCVFSLIHEPTDLKDVEVLWRWIINHCNKYLDETSINHTKWLQAEDLLINVINNRNLSAHLTLNSEGGFTNGKDKLKLYNKFISNVLILRFDTSISCQDDIIDGDNNVENEIKKFITKNKIEFLRWVYEDKKKVRMYPSQEVCKKNIIYNDRVLLVKDNKLMIRTKSKYLTEDFEHIKYEKKELEKWTNNEYGYVIFDYTHSNIISLNKFLSESNDFINLLQNGLSIRKRTLTFIKKYFDIELVKTVNIFEQGHKIECNEQLPFIPWSYYDKYFIIDELSDKIQNTKRNFDTLLMKSLKEQGLKLYSDKLEHNIENINDKIIPKSFYHYKWEYINTLLETLNKDHINDSYYFELCKILTISVFFERLPQDAKIKDGMKSVYKYLEIYNSLYTNEGSDSYLMKLIYGISLDNTINDDNFEKFYMTIYDSLEYFYNSIGGINEDFKMLDLLNEELKNVSNLLTKKKKGQTNEYIKMYIEYDESFSELNLWYQNNETNDKYVFKEEQINSIEILDLSKEKLNIAKINIFDIDRYDFCFFNYNQNLMIVIPEIMIKSYEIITKRYKAYERYCNDYNYLQLFINLTTKKREYKIKDNFHKSVEILKNNWNDNETSKIEEYLFKWLFKFDEKYHEALLEIISKHEAITQEDINNFREKIRQLVNDDNSILFHYKTISDINGLHGLFENRSKIRNLGLNTCLLNNIKNCNNETEKTLVIVGEFGKSGSQLLNSLKRYYLLKEMDGKKLDKHLETQREKNHYFKIIKKEDFHEIEGNKGFYRSNLINKIIQFKKIIFLNTIYSDKYEEKVKKYFKEELNYKGEIIFIGRKFKIKGTSLKDVDINVDYVNKFKELIINVDLLSDIFNLDESEILAYKKYLKQYFERGKKGKDNFSFIVRRLSVPKYHHPIFTLGNEPLFYRPKDKEIINIYD